MTTQNKKIVYVIGHKNPDTDSVCSAIGYAYFKNIIDKRFLYIPVRAGRINEETCLGVRLILPIKLHVK